MGVLSEAAVARMDELAAKYPRKRSALLGALHIAQNELGWLSPDTMTEVAAVLGLDVDEVEQVATFYTMFYTDPVGEFVFEICKTLPCSIMGSDELVEHLSRRLGIQPGETTPDGMFTLKTVECLAACHRAPMMQVNHRYVQDLSPDKIDGLLEEARNGSIRHVESEKFSIEPTWSESVLAER